MKKRAFKKLFVMICLVLMMSSHSVCVWGSVSVPLVDYSSIYEEDDDDDAWFAKIALPVLTGVAAGRAIKSRRKK